MAKTLQDWLVEIGNKPIPVLRRSIDEMARLSRQGDRVNNDAIASLVYHDPLLSCAILRHINSLPRRGLANEVTTVDHAVMMMGVAPFFEWVKRLPVLEEELPADERVWQPLRRSMARAYHVATQSLDWAVLRSDARADEVFIAGLLDNFVELLMWIRAGNEMRAVRRMMIQSRLDFSAAFARHFDYALDDFRLALFQALKLPDLYVDFASGKNAARSRGIEVTLASRVGVLAERGWWQEGWLPLVESVAELTHLPLDEIAGRIERNTVHAASQWQWYGVAPAAAWLPMQPGDWPPEPIDEEMADQALRADSSEVCLMPHPDKLKQVMEEITAHLDGSSNLNQLMARVLLGMHEGLALDRVVFALVGRDQRHVKARFVRGVEEHSSLRALEFNLADPNLFSQLMKKMQGLWYQDSNQARFRPMLNAGLLAQIGEGEFFAMSVFVHNKPVGMFYADRRHDGCALDEHSYQGFKQLCLKAAEGLAHLSKKPPVS